MCETFVILKGKSFLINKKIYVGRRYNKRLMFSSVSFYLQSDEYLDFELKINSMKTKQRNNKILSYQCLRASVS